MRAQVRVIAGVAIEQGEGQHQRPVGGKGPGEKEAEEFDQREYQHRAYAYQGEQQNHQARQSAGNPWRHSSSSH